MQIEKKKRPCVSYCFFIFIILFLYFLISIFAATKIAWKQQRTKKEVDPVPKLKSVHSRLQKAEALLSELEQKLN